ncbi:Peroxisomal membrane protein PEX30 [Spathaspora sp. JA1]|nr:Peroxisomal membrane protein PEX30 [Spathaspora sp. JA1]
MSSSKIHHWNMPEFNKNIRAAFEPSDTLLLTTTPNRQLLVEFPTLVSALSQIFPYLLLIDYLLEIITWTNEDHYENFLILVVYTCIVLYWKWISYLVLPLILAIVFTTVDWSISSVIYDSKYDEKPTIEEVLHTLHNITVRFEMLFRPFKTVPLTLNNFVKLYIVAIMLTPLHLILARTILSPQNYLCILGIALFTFHSPWAFAIRRLLWRSLYVRIAAVYLTGMDIKITKTNEQFPSRTTSAASSDVEDSSTIPILGDFKIIKKSIVSPTRVKQMAVFEILENERRWIGLGWCKLLYPHERSNFCFEKSLNTAPNIKDTTIDQDRFPFPIFENDLYKYTWEWVDTDWILDEEYNKSKTEDGWVYFDTKWTEGRYRDGFSRYTRSRKWTRKATLLIDKQDTVYDE